MALVLYAGESVGQGVVMRPSFDSHWRQLDGTIRQQTIYDTHIFDHPKAMKRDKFFDKAKV